MLASACVLTFAALGAVQGCGPEIVDTPTPSAGATETPTASGPTPTPTATPVGQTPTPTPVPGCNTIRSIQDLLDPNHPAIDDTVTVCGAVVTAIDSDGTIFIGAPAGGAYTGIYVYQPGSASVIPSTIAIGDKVDITGVYAEFFGANQITLSGDDASLTVLSSDNPLPPPVVITDIASISTPCDGSTGAEAYKYEGVRLQLIDTIVTDLNPCDQGQYGVYEVNDLLYIDDDLRKDYTPTETGIEIGSLTGILHYTFDHFRLFPGPGDTELEGGLPTPPPDPACTRIEDLQDPSAGADPSAEAEVKVCDVVVTGVDSRGRFIVQEQDGDEYSGIYVFRRDSFDLPENFAVGDVVDVRATFAEAFGSRQLSLDEDALKEPRIDVKSTGATLPAAIEVADATTIATPCVADGETLVDGADARKYEAVRVTVSDVTVTDINPCEQGDFGVFEVADSLYVDDDFGSEYFPTETGVVLDSITGVLYKSFDHYRLLPGPDGVEVAEVEATPTPE